RELERRVVATGEVVPVREQPERPRPALSITELFEGRHGGAEPLLGPIVITCEERHPRQVLLHPRLPPHVAGLAEQRLGLAEEPLRIAERTAEHLGEPARPQRLGETRRVAELAEDPDRLAEIPT